MLKNVFIITLPVDFFLGFLSSFNFVLYLCISNTVSKLSEFLLINKSKTSEAALQRYSWEKVF